MAKTPKTKDEPEGDPRRGDQILRRMLKTKPKTHEEMVSERHKRRGQKAPPPKR